MKVLLTVLVVSMLFAGVLAVAGTDGVVNLSTLGKKQTMEPVVLPKLSPTMPTISPTKLGENVSPSVLDLSTLGKKKTTPTMPPVNIRGPTPITFTPGFAIKNANVTTEANTIFTLPQAISSNATVYTPPIAIFGGA